MNYAEALGWLYATQDRGIKLGLEHVRHLLGVLGWRQPQGQRFIHVAGTNGKGSVCAMLDAMLRAGGYRTGLFTSPHLVTFRERIQVQGEMAPPQLIAGELSRIRAICEAHELNPTFFELTTALALLIFQQEECGAVVLETGLGGRLDATNIIQPEVAVVTSIGLDHTALLGSTLAAIAWEKGGIIKPGVPVVAGALPAEAAEVIAGLAEGRKAPLAFVNAPERERALSLEGPHQQLNAEVALRALREGGFAMPDAQAAEGLQNVQWPGRFQRCGSRFILDGAHNPEAAQQLAQTWRRAFGERKAPIILGVLQDKDAGGICAALAGIAERFLIVPVRSPRTTPVESLCRIARRFRPSFVFSDLAQAMAETTGQSRLAIVCGSLFLIGEALSVLGLAEGEPEMSAQ